VKEALDFLEPHIKPDCLIPQFRHHALKERTDNYVEREGQQQVLRATSDRSLKATAELFVRFRDEHTAVTARQKGVAYASLTWASRTKW
jgi:hypothetical protein